jgi:hypothetical protein
MESHKIPWFQTTNQPQFKMMACEPLTSIATLAGNAWWLLENSFCGHGEKKWITTESRSNQPFKKICNICKWMIALMS